MERRKETSRNADRKFPANPSARWQEAEYVKVREYGDRIQKSRQKWKLNFQKLWREREGRIVRFPSLANIAPTAQVHKQAASSRLKAEPSRPSPLKLEGAVARQLWANFKQAQKERGREKNQQGSKPSLHALGPVVGCELAIGNPAEEEETQCAKQQEQQEIEGRRESEHVAEEQYDDDFET